ncbi:MAG: Mur ligase family protein, partial [Cyclobacteriaceae bacterium]|nr:Mur ligase family protein [Cyclobacteriaceae bacterium]
KGTSAHTLAAIFQAAGYKTGLYTSPHLKRFTERIRIDGVEISEDGVVRFVDRIRPAIEEVSPSFFEVTVAMAFDYFARQEVDIAIVETGLGGRLDSTNVIVPELCLITSIGFDHMDILGHTLEKIASEKAGIIKPGIPVVIGAHQPDILSVFTEKARELNAPCISNTNRYQVHVVDDTKENRTIRVVRDGMEADYDVQIRAGYYLNNIPGILESVIEMRKLGWNLTPEAVGEGLRSAISMTGLKGRFQLLSETPFTVADISHNKDGLTELFRHVGEMGFAKWHIIYGTVRDKDVAAVLGMLPTGATYYFTQSGVPRSLPVDELKIMATKSGIEGEVFTNVNEALAAARQNVGKNDLILITGSTFVVAEIDEL